MEDGSREHGVGLAERQHIVEMLELACTARGDDRHVDSLRNRARELDVVAVLRAVAVHAREQDFARAEFRRAPDPFEAVKARRRAAAIDVDLPLVVAAALCIDGEHDALAAEALGTLADDGRILDSRRIQRRLVRAGLEHLAHVFDRADAAANREWDEDFRCASARDIDNRVALVARRRDVEEDELIRALLVIPRRKLDGVACITQADEVRALDDAAVFDVQAGNNSLRIQFYSPSLAISIASCKSRLPV